MSQISSGPRGSRVKSIISLLQRKNTPVAQSASDDDQSVHSCLSNSSRTIFCDAPNGVVRDLKESIEERIRRSSFRPEKLLPKLKGKKFCLSDIVSELNKVDSSLQQTEKEFSIGEPINVHYSTDYQQYNSSSHRPPQHQEQNQNNSSSNGSTDGESITNQENRTRNPSIDAELTNFNNKAQNLENKSSQILVLSNRTTPELERSIITISSPFQNIDSDSKLMNPDDSSTASTVTSVTGGTNDKTPRLQGTANESFTYIPQFTTKSSRASLPRLDSDLSGMASLLLDPELCDDQLALKYSLLLVENDITDIETLRMQVLNDPELLKHLGIDDETILRLMKCLLTKEELLMRRGFKQSTPFLVRSKSVKRAELYNFEQPPSVIAELYHRATQQNDIDSCKCLVGLGYQGNPFAQGFLMKMYAVGQGSIDRSVEQAEKLGEQLFPWLLQVIEAEIFDDFKFSMYAKYMLAVCYTEGFGTTKDHCEAARWYTESAEEGYEAAQAYLAHCYYIGQGVPRDREIAVDWYRQSASRGYAAAQCNLGMCYELGDGVEQDYGEAIKWFTCAAAQNDSKAQYNVGRCYEKGIGVEIDLDKALYYYKLSADQDHAAALYSVGLFYFSGNETVEKNYEEAFFWFLRSAGLNYAPAQCKLGLCYEKGIGVAKSYKDAVHYYSLSAQQGEPSALYYLGFCYSNGLGVEKNLEKAVVFYSKSADKGYSAAQNNLGYCYFSGLGVEKNYSEAAKWYKLSAKQGYPPAQYNMGFCYEKGFGVEKKPQEMFKWYRLAAAQGQTKATLALERLQSSSSANNFISR